MITPNNLADLLAALGLQKTKAVWRKAIAAASLEADFAKQQLIYPEAQGLIAAAPARKQAIMQRYL